MTCQQDGQLLALSSLSRLPATDRPSLRSDMENWAVSSKASSCVPHRPLRAQLQGRPQGGICCLAVPQSGMPQYTAGVPLGNLAVLQQKICFCPHASSSRWCWLSCQQAASGHISCGADQPAAMLQASSADHNQCQCCAGLASTPVVLSGRHAGKEPLPSLNDAENCLVHSCCCMLGIRHMYGWCLQAPWQQGRTQPVALPVKLTMGQRSW